MPFISTKTNMTVTEAQEQTLKNRLGEAITLLNKSESWLMLEFTDNCRMYFRGEKSQNYAYVEIKLFGKASNQCYDKMTAEVTKIIQEELGIAGEGIYVQYEEIDHWGYNGVNF